MESSVKNRFAQYKSTKNTLHFFRRFAPVTNLGHANVTFSFPCPYHRVLTVLTHTHTRTPHKFLHKLDPVDWIRCRLIPCTGSGKLDPLHWIRSTGSVRNWIRSKQLSGSGQNWIRSTGKQDPVRLPKTKLDPLTGSDRGCRKLSLDPDRNQFTSI